VNVLALLAGQFLTVRRGRKLNRNNFGVCNWRPDSETVASRAFAQTST
jgi:hypothetical protein